MNNQSITTTLPWAVRINYRNRSLCFILLFVMFWSHMAGKGYGPVVWVLLAFQFLVYPHLLFRWARNRPHPNHAELRNLELDAISYGAWSAGLGFPLWITFILFSAGTLNLTAFRGVHGLALALVLMAAGAGIGMLAGGARIEPETSHVTTFLCIASVQLYTLMLSYGIFERAGKLKAARRRLRESEAELQQANHALQEQLDEIESLHAQLHEQANRDPLTGLYNRRYLEATMERELARCQREGHPLGLILIDIDHFKSINDRFGHPAGDEVIKAMARLLQTRASDVVCRYGGEEFLLLLPNIPQETAFERAMQYRRAFEEQVLRFGDSTIRGTLSAGIACYPAHGNTAEELLRCADQALYQAKQEGRNKVIMFRSAPRTASK